MLSNKFVLWVEQNRSVGGRNSEFVNSWEIFLFVFSSFALPYGSLPGFWVVTGILTSSSQCELPIRQKGLFPVSPLSGGGCSWHLMLGEEKGRDGVSGSVHTTFPCAIFHISRMLSFDTEQQAAC